MSQKKPISPDLSLTNSPIFNSEISTATTSTNSSSSKLSSISKETHFKDINVISSEQVGNSTKTSFCSVSNIEQETIIDVNPSSFKTVCHSKPHKSNDARWEAIQTVQEKEENLGLGDFSLLKKLGFGDIGSVYLAELKDSNGVLFAIKVMDKGVLITRKKMGRAETEREILGLLDHPFLPTLYSGFETDRFSCLVMEFCSGGDLHLLRQKQAGKRFSEDATRFYVSEVLLALEYLHMMGVIYRDLKPENVLVREDGHIMLSDFDLSLRCYVNPTLLTSSNSLNCKISAYCIVPLCNVPAEPSCFQPTCFKPRFFKPKVTKQKAERTASVSDSLPVLVVEPTSARSMSFVGTHEYLAPEIIRGDGHGSSVDWWMFGILLYELLYGKTPFKGKGNRETLFNVVGKPLKFPEDSIVSLAAKDLIQELLAKDPSKRLGFKRGATEIKQHPFFESVNWALIRGNSPPIIPKPVDIAELKRKIKSSMSSNQKGVASESESSSGLYLDFDFF